VREPRYYLQLIVAAECDERLSSSGFRRSGASVALRVQGVDADGKLFNSTTGRVDPDCDNGALAFRQLVERFQSSNHMGCSKRPQPWMESQGCNCGVSWNRSSSAQTSSQSVTSGSGQYYVEFRSRQAWDYGHTFVVFGRVGETPGKKNVAGLSPKGDDPKMWVMGHYMPVPADTGWTDGDLEDRYITSRYRVLINKEQYDRVRRWSQLDRPVGSLP
jgi:hypothetical protein